MKNSILFAAPLAALVLSACSGGAGGGAAPPPSGNENSAPVIAGLDAQQSILQDGSSDLIAFEIDDTQTAADELEVTVASSNEELMPAAGIQVSGNGAARTLLLTPEPGVSGTATITVSVKDPEGLAAAESFALQVTSREKSFQEFALAQFDVDPQAQPSEVAGHRWVETAEDDPAAFDSVLNPIAD